MQAVRYQTDHQCLIISSVVFIRQEASHLLFIDEYTVKCVSVSHGYIRTYWQFSKQGFGM